MRLSSRRWLVPSIPIGYLRGPVRGGSTNVLGSEPEPQAVGPGRSQPAQARKVLGARGLALSQEVSF